jgi:hypothetical protein
MSRIVRSVVDDTLLLLLWLLLSLLSLSSVTSFVIDFRTVRNPIRIDVIAPIDLCLPQHHRNNYKGDTCTNTGSSTTKLYASTNENTNDIPNNVKLLILLN